MTGYKYRFVVKSKPPRQDSRKAFMDEHNPRVKITRTGVYLPEVIYASLGRPDKTTIAVDEVHKAMKIEASDFGYKVKPLKYTDGTVSYQAITAQSTHKIDRYVGKLPLGLYKPLGGGIFEYDPSV
jgi:hypothetical protein